MFATNIPDMRLLLGQNMMFLRGEKTQKDIANEIGVNFTTISSYENGRTLITLSGLLDFCISCNTNPNEVLMVEPGSEMMKIGGVSDRQVLKMLHESSDGVDFELWKEISNMSLSRKEALLNFLKAANDDPLGK